VSGVNAFDLVVPDWGQLLEVSGLSQGAFTVLLNKKPQTVPFRYSKVKGHREEYIDVKFADAGKVHLEVTTSFGVKIETTRGGYDSTYSIPRHPDLFNNTAGLLGRWNDNTGDDNIDANGKVQPLDFMWSVAYGDSWHVRPEGLPTQCELDLAKALHEQHLNTFNKEHWEHLKKMCESNLHHAEFHHCQKSVGHPPHLVEDCVIDLSHIIEEEHQHEYLRTMVAKYKRRCPHHEIEFKHHPRPKHIPNHKPIHHPTRHHHPMHDPKGHEDHKGPHHHGDHKGPHHHHGIPKYVHEKDGPAKPEHKDKCVNLRKQLHKDGVKLLECLKFEEFFDEE